MNDLISRQSVKNWLAKWEGYIDHDLIARMQCRVIDIPSAQPEIIRCKDCVNHVDRNFCRKANHYTGDGEYCASVFGAERRTGD